MIVDAAHPLLRALRASADEVEGREAWRIAEQLEAALAASQDMTGLDDATVTARVTAARIALFDARRYVTGGGGPGAPLARHLDAAHRTLLAQAVARFGPGQDLVPPCHLL